MTFAYEVLGLELNIFLLKRLDVLVKGVPSLLKVKITRKMHVPPLP